MKKIEELSVRYNGYSKPESRDEVMLEILGLESAVKNAELRIAVLKQSLQLAAMLEKDKSEEAATEITNVAKTV